MTRLTRGEKSATLKWWTIKHDHKNLLLFVSLLLARSSSVT